MEGFLLAIYVTLIYIYDYMFELMYNICIIQYYPAGWFLFFTNFLIVLNSIFRILNYFIFYDHFSFLNVLIISNLFVLGSSVGMVLSPNSTRGTFFAVFCVGMSLNQNILSNYYIYLYPMEARIKIIKIVSFQKILVPICVYLVTNQIMLRHGTYYLWFYFILSSFLVMFLILSIKYLRSQHSSQEF